MTPTHQHLLTQLHELHKQIGEVLHRLEQAEQTPYRPNLKAGDEAPAIEWLKMMDEPERSMALGFASDERVKLKPERVVSSIHQAIDHAFDWDKAGSYRHWSNVYAKYQHAHR